MNAIGIKTAATVGSPALNIGIFLLFVAFTLYIVLRVSRTNRSATDFYAGGRAFSGRQNGIAILATTCPRHPSWGSRARSH